MCALLYFYYTRTSIRESWEILVLVGKMYTYMHVRISPIPTSYSTMYCRLTCTYTTWVSIEITPECMLYITMLYVYFMCLSILIEMCTCNVHLHVCVCVCVCVCVRTYTLLVYKFLFEKSVCSAMGNRSEPLL